MGIPKYFRYVSQRWPNISQLVNDSVIPEFDNLYLDMNSILHTCTHNNQENVQMSEREMFVAIFNYIDHLFNVIAPRKVFYMAIDGVAPRAKMNQQRARRFRSALDAENARKEAIKKGMELKEDPFDSNCITPGTEFMDKLSEQLRYFISRKVSEDSRWQSCRVILSGHEVPGEGEHKIMNFIRALRSDPAWDPNTRHCLYGLDADLIMLGLSTHEPHFALLREEVTFGRQIRFQSAELSQKRFFLLHLSLVREYLQIELNDILGTYTNLDFERMLDDFILINFFIGNDFLPELPMLMVNDGAVPVILDTYKRYLSESQDYISHNGVINFQNLRKWMIELSGYQTERFEDESRDAQWFNNQLDLVGGALKEDPELILTPHQKELVRELRPGILSAAETGVVEIDTSILTNQDDKPFLDLIAKQTGFRIESQSRWTLDTADTKQWLTSTRKVLRVYEKAPVASAERQELYDQKFRQWRDRYYSRKFQAPASSELVGDVVYNYLEGLQWVLSYYYRGCPSWSWYFHYHYSPMTTELINAITPDFKIEFDLGEPFKPFEQLMGVLPDRSIKLIPPAWRDLVLDESSPIRDFYPHEFALDKNGKKADWEAVVLIPFIDEKRLLAAVRPRERLLSDDERRRNSRGNELEFVYDANVSAWYHSPLESLADFDSHCVVRVPHYPNHKLRYGLLEKSKQGSTLLAGFPSLYTLPFKWSIEKGNVKVFEQEFRGESVLLTITTPQKLESATEVEKRLHDRNIFVEYPFLREAKVTRVSPDSSRSLGPLTRGYTNHGINIGHTQVTVYYQLLQGLVKHPDGSYKKEFGGEENAIPLQLVVEEVEEEDERFRERQAVPVAEEFPVGSPCVLLLSKFYGSPATIKGTSPSTGNGDTVDVEALNRVNPETRFGNHVALKERENVLWVGLNEAARKLGVDISLLAQLTARFVVVAQGSKADVSVCLRKPAMGLMAEGLARPGFRGGWEFSQRGLALVAAFIHKFPELISKLRKFKYRSGPPPDLFTVWGLAPGDSQGQTEALRTVAAVRSWLQENMSDVAYVPTTTHHMSAEFVREIESRVVAQDNSNAKERVARVDIQNLPRDAVLSPANAPHQLWRQEFHLGNRVISVLTYGAVPMFSRGTVIGVNGDSNPTVDVIWDHTFGTANTLDGRLTTKRGLTVPVSSVLNISHPQLVFLRPGEERERRPAEALRTGSRTGKAFVPKAPTKKLVPAPKRQDWAPPQVPSGPAVKSTLARADPAKVDSDASPKAPEKSFTKPSGKPVQKPGAKIPHKPAVKSKSKSPPAQSKQSSKPAPKSEPKFETTPQPKSNAEGKQLLAFLNAGASQQKPSKAAQAKQDSPKPSQPESVQSTPAEFSKPTPATGTRKESPKIPELQTKKRDSNVAARLLAAASGTPHI